MDAARHSRIKSLFLELCDVSPTSRRDALDRACPDDPELRADVEALLAEDLEPQPSLDEPLFRSCFEAADAAAPSRSPSAASEAMPRRVGKYEIDRKIGEGGMGTVYEAIQENPHRRVALKLISSEWATPSAVKRFEYEAEILGRLEHPGIARIYEAASSADAETPFIAMELVRGYPITEFATREHLDRRQRLELIASVCDAIQHAHQRGVIHRDLKPQNILVQSTEDGPAAKIVDFGIARPLGAEGMLRTVRTVEGQIVGTLLYMSPEQLAGTVDLDTRSDVYALGVVAYQLLTSTYPYDLDGKSFATAASELREREPVPAAERDRSLRGDVSTVLSKALAKSRDRRYATANEFAADIRRHLQEQPILARPSSSFYHLSKFIRRRRGVVALLSIALVATITGVVGTVRQSIRANARLQEAEAVTSFLGNALRSIDSRASGSDVRVIDILARALRDARTLFGDQPLVRAALLDSIGLAYQSIHDYKTAESCLTESLELRRAHGAEEALVVDSMQHLGVLLVNRDEADRARPLLLESLDRQRALYGEEDLRIAATLDGLGVLGLAQGGEDTKAYLEAALAMRRKLHGGDHPEIISSLHHLASEADNAGEYPVAESLYLEAIEVASRLYSHDHPDSILPKEKLARLFIEMGDFDRAEPLIAETLEFNRRFLPKDDTDLAWSLITQADLLRHRRNFDEALPLVTEGLRIIRKAHGDEHGEVVNALNLLSILQLEGFGDTASAERSALEAVAASEKMFGKQSVRTAVSMGQLATIAAWRGQGERAESIQNDVVSILREHDPSPVLATKLRELGFQEFRNGKVDLAESHLREALRLQMSFGGADQPAISDFEIPLARLLIQKDGESREAERLLNHVVRVLTGSEKTPVFMLGYAHWFLGKVLLARGDYGEAEREVRKGLEILRSYLTEHVDLRLASSDLGFCLARLERYDEAQVIFEDNYQFYRSRDGAAGSATRRHAQRLLMLYRGRGDERADALEREIESFDERPKDPRY